VVRRHLPRGYREVVNWGMICYEIPLKPYPTTYNGQPLCYAAVAAQKNYYTVHLMCAHDPKQQRWLKAGFEKAGKKLDMGKACIRFRRVEDLPLEVKPTAPGRATANSRPSCSMAAGNGT
jgi:hypothetical protein